MKKHDDLYEEIHPYLNQIRGIPLLSPKELKTLSEIIHNSNNENEILIARNKMMQANYKLVISIACKMYKNFVGIRDFYLTLSDLIQEGNIGLAEAVTRYDYKRKIKFSTYAFYHIRAKILNAARKSHFVRIPDKHFTYITKLEKLKAKYKTKDIDDEIAMKELKIPIEILRLIKIEKNQKENIINENRFFSKVADWRTEVTNPYEHKQMKNYLFSKIKELSLLEKKIIIMLFFGEHDVTFEKMAKKLKISRQAIQQHYSRSIKKIKMKILEDQSRANLKLKTPFNFF